MTIQQIGIAIFTSGLTTTILASGVTTTILTIIFSFIKSSIDYKKNN
jgi:hypothetical protein